MQAWHGGPASRSVERVTPPRIDTLGELRSSDHVQRTVKTEIRDNLIARLAAGEPTLPGIVGFDETVTPEIERALLAGHDIVLLGERGQGKTRLIRTLVGLLDEWTPVIDGCEINDHPYEPVVHALHRASSPSTVTLTPVAWKHRSERYGEKLATPGHARRRPHRRRRPDQGRRGTHAGDPETIHYGLVPRTNRGIFAINELPDLAERIQVALLNVLEERDIQVRGYALRLPLDLLLVASANPEDYTNRGRIITPLKDRFGAEVRTHYPLRAGRRDDLVRQEAGVLWPDSEHGAPARARAPLEVVARFARPSATHRRSTSARASRRGSPSPASRRWPPPRCAERRSPARRSPSPGSATCRRVVPASRGKVEFEDSRRGPRGRGAGAPAAPRHRRDVPGAAGRAGPAPAAGASSTGA